MATLIALIVFLFFPIFCTISMWVYLRHLPSLTEISNALPFAYVIMGVPALLSALTHVAWPWRYQLVAVCVVSFCLSAIAARNLVQRPLDMVLFGVFGLVAGAVCSLVAAILVRRLIA